MDTVKTIKAQNYMPPILSTICVMGGAYSWTSGRQAVLATAYSSLERSMDCYKLKVFKAVHSNNWLKIHGYPMKRKGES